MNERWIRDLWEKGLKDAEQSNSDITLLEVIDVLKDSAVVAVTIHNENGDFLTLNANLDGISGVGNLERHFNEGGGSPDIQIVIDGDEPSIKFVNVSDDRKRKIKRKAPDDLD